MMVKHAMEGNHFKAALEHFACRCAIEALGLEEEMEGVESGQRYYSLKLYESRAVAKAVTRDISRIKQKIYGIEIGPLEELEDADVVMLMVNAYQLMRVVQGIHISGEFQRTCIWHGKSRSMCGFNCWTI